jgi:hypothetical protein
MKTSNIQVGRLYEVLVGRGTAFVKVVAVNPKTGAWICETQNGKEMRIGDSSRFLNPLGEGKNKKGKQPKECVQKPTSCQPVAKMETVTKLNQAFKEAAKKQRAAYNAFQHGMIDQTKLDSVIAEYDTALVALRNSGGKAGSGGRCLGLMSALDSAYQVLAETGESMNVRQIYDAVIDKGYWDPQGATPEATISSAIVTEMRKQGEHSRFERISRGLFAAKK